MFGHQQPLMGGAKPDVITYAKGLSSGYMPISATFVSEEIYNNLNSPLDRATRHPHLDHFRQINTYGGHPVAAAVAQRNIEIIEEENLAQRAKSLGDQFQDWMTEAFG